MLHELSRQDLPEERERRVIIESQFLQQYPSRPLRKTLVLTQNKRL